MAATANYGLTYPDRGEPMRLGRAHFQNNAEATDDALTAVAAVAAAAEQTSTSTAADVNDRVFAVEGRMSEVETEMAAVLNATDPGTGGDLDSVVAGLIAVSTSDTAVELRRQFERGPTETLYVNPAIGDDSRTGHVASAPLATIAAALAALPPAGGQVQLAAGTHPLPAAGLVLDPARHALRGVPGTVLDASGLTAGGTALTVASTGGLPYRTVRTFLEDIELAGPGELGTEIGILFDADSPGANAMLSPRNLDVHHFGTGTRFADQTWCLSFFGCTWSDCSTALHSPAGVVNGGERLSFLGCTIYNNAVTGLQADHPNATLMFQACSFDYNGNGRQFQIGGSQVFLTDCHVEGRTSFPNSVATITGNSGLLRMSGGALIMTGGGESLAPTIIENNAPYSGGGAIFDGVYMYNLRTANRYFATGTGYTALRDIITHPGQADVLEQTSAAMNLLADGDMELTTIVDGWAATGNATIAKTTSRARAGTRSLEVAKLFGNGDPAGLALYVPVARGCRPLWRLWWSKPGTATGTIWWTAQAALIEDTPAGPVVRRSATLAQTSSTLTSAATDWTELATGPHQPRLPAWATHFRLTANLNAVGAGTIYIDTAEVTTA